MAEAFRSEESIRRTPGEVWRALTDWERAPAWMDGVDELRADGPVEAGTRLTFRARGREHTAAITDAEAGRAVVIRSVQGNVTAEYRYELHDDGDGTRVTLVAECRAAGITRLFGPALRSAIRRSDSGQLAALKQLVEDG